MASPAARATRSNPLATTLFWLMFGLGGGCLVLSVYLPQWLAYRDLRHRHQTAVHRVADLESQLTMAAKQIEHMQNDPAYIARLAHRQLGVEEKNSQSIGVDALAPPQSQASDLRDAGSAAHVEEVVETAAHTHPVLSLFVLEQTRPIVMGMSAALVVAALALLNQRGRSGNWQANTPE